ncbi:hypothetical protein [Bradyrhizobium sp. Gha]|nr:hypothetical protein [Bradyrhizobium sp. Gha]SFJ30967.1 hypothetical protein SAMN05216525_12240 [Bradyrhizobium sp. Gha]
MSEFTNGGQDRNLFRQQIMSRRFRVDQVRISVREHGRANRRIVQ